MNDFEIHVTVDHEDPEEVGGWVRSLIQGDPCGRTIYTRHEATFEAAEAAMRALERQLRIDDYDVTRAKIEHVVLDERYT